MAVVVSVSVPDDLKKKWDRSNLKISPSQIFQIALETQLDGKNKHLQHWSSRALSAEKKLKLLEQVLGAKDIDIKSSLVRQLENPVQWAKSILDMKSKGMNHFIEVGPGKVLQGLNRRIDRSIISQGVDSITKLEQIDV